MSRFRVMVMLLAAVVLGACGSGGGTDDTAAPAASATTMAEHGGAAMNTSCSPSGTTVSVVASGTRFASDCLAAPANQPFTVSYENKDTIGHNLVFLESHTATSVMFRADIFVGPATKTFSAGPFPPGTYAFHCEVHPAVMMGTLVVN